MNTGYQAASSRMPHQKHFCEILKHIESFPTKSGWQVGPNVSCKSFSQNAVAAYVKSLRIQSTVIASTLNVEDIATAYVRKRASATSLPIPITNLLPRVTRYSLVDAPAWVRPCPSVAVYRRIKVDGQ